MPPATGPSLAAVLRDAVADRFPPADGGVVWLPPDDRGTCAVVELTGRSYLLTDRTPDELSDLHGYGGCSHPDVVRRLAGPAGRIGSLDAVLVTTTRGGVPLPERHDLDDHPRVIRSRHHRDDVRVFGDERGLVTIGRGLVGRTELSVELVGDPGDRVAGTGRSLIERGLATLPAGWVVWAQVAPGNAASLRAFLAAGFTPIGSEILIEP